MGWGPALFVLCYAMLFIYLSSPEGMLIDFGEGIREGKREGELLGNIDRLPLTGSQPCSLIGNQTLSLSRLWEQAPAK